MAVIQYNADTIPASAKLAVDAAAVALTKRLAAVAGFNAGVAFCAANGAQQHAEYHAAQMELIRVQTEWFKSRLAEQDAEKNYRDAYLDHLSDLRKAVEKVAGIKNEGSDLPATDA